MVMKDSSTQLLLAEHERLRAKERGRAEICQQSLQFYLAIISATTAGLLFIVEHQQSLDSMRLNLALLLGVTFLLGEVTYLRLLGEDIGLIEISRRFQVIRDKFIAEDEQLGGLLPVMLVQNAKAFSYWSSARGILDRVLSVSGVKTTVVLLNCFVATGLAIVITWPGSFLVGVLVCLGMAVLVAVFHGLHATWRYRQASKNLREDVASWWM